MIKNKIFFFTILIFLSQCGYQTIYSNKNLNFSVTKIKILNDQNIGRQIKNRLGLLNSNTNADSLNLINYSLINLRTKIDFQNKLPIERFDTNVFEKHDFSRVPPRRLPGRLVRQPLPETAPNLYCCR